MKQIVSVIVPIYNVKSYLTQSVDSIRNQSYQHIQIILVDDGSTDGSGNLCDCFEKEDHRIQVIHQKNGGLSHARNTGLRFAKGEFVAFVDSDDFLEKDYIKTLLLLCNKYETDISICEFRKIYNFEQTQNVITCDINITTKVFCQEDLFCSMYAQYHENYTSFIVAWNKLYKRSLWKEVTFPEGRIHEDEATIYKLFAQVKSAVYTNQPLYNYRQTPGSIMQENFHEKRFDWLTALKERIAFFEKICFNQGVYLSYKTYADGAITLYRQINKTIPNYKNRKQEMKKIVKTTMTEIRQFGTLPFRTKTGYYIFLFAPQLFYILLGKGNQTTR